MEESITIYDDLELQNLQRKKVINSPIFLIRHSEGEFSSEEQFNLNRKF